MRRRCGIRSLRERAPRLRAAEDDITNAAAGRGEKIMSTFPIMRLWMPTRICANRRIYGPSESISSFAIAHRALLKI